MNANYQAVRDLIFAHYMTTARHMFFSDIAAQLGISVAAVKRAIDSDPDAFDTFDADIEKGPWYSRRVVLRRAVEPSKRGLRAIINNWGQS